MNILLGYILSFSYVFLVLGVAYFIKKIFKCSTEIPRKIVHIFVSFTWVIMIHYFSNTYHILIPCIAFTIVNFISSKTGLLSMIERKGEKEKSYGTAYYAISMLILATISIFDIKFLPAFGIGLFCMAFGDGLAPFFGKRIKSVQLMPNKTVAGTLTVFICSIVTVVLFQVIYKLPLSILEIIIIAIVSCILEAISKKGFDNLILPIGVSLLTYIFILL